MTDFCATFINLELYMKGDQFYQELSKYILLSALGDFHDATMMEGCI